MSRVINFSAGPSTIPLSVLEHAKAEFTDYKGNGYSIMEISHRTKIFEEVLHSAMARVKRLYGFGENFKILFLQGGGSLQFAQVPMNLMTPGGYAEYANTGNWTNKAIKEAEILGINHKVVASSKESKFDHIPEFAFSDDADYGYICSNNTIYGTQYKALPKCKCPLVVDSSSDLFSRPVDISSVGLFYGGIQKNGGPAGVTMVAIREDLLDRAENTRTPMILRYKTHSDADSMYNTPNTFGIYMLDLMLAWIEDEISGLAKMAQRNEQKAQILYDAIDASNGFFVGHARKDSRSLMNVSFNIASGAETEAKFIAEASAAGMIGLKGHRVLGGIRASLYNAITVENVQTLVSFMNEFVRKNG